MPTCTRSASKWAHTHHIQSFVQRSSFVRWLVPTQRKALTAPMITSWSGKVRVHHAHCCTWAMMMYIAPFYTMTHLGSQTSSSETKLETRVATLETREVELERKVAQALELIGALTVRLASLETQLPKNVDDPIDAVPRARSVIGRLRSRYGMSLCVCMWLPAACG